MPWPDPLPYPPYTTVGELSLHGVGGRWELSGSLSSLGSSIAALSGSTHDPDLNNAGRPRALDEVIANASHSRVCETNERTLYLSNMTISPTPDFIKDANWNSTTTDAQLTWTGRLDTQGKEIISLVPDIPMESVRPVNPRDPYGQDFNRSKTKISRMVLTNPSFKEGRGMVDNHLTFQEIKEGLLACQVLWARFEAFHEAEADAEHAESQ